MFENFKIPVETKPAIWGAIGGAALTAIVGFSWGGWVTGGTAMANASQAAGAAVVKAMVPLCVDKFKLHADAAANLLELKKAGSWQQAGFIEKGGWATAPGGAAPDAAVARACAETLASAKT